MPGLFIDIKVQPEAAADLEVAKKLVDVCPVNIFALKEREGLTIVEKELDECVLCELCLQAAPRGSVQIIKLYEQ